MSEINFVSDIYFGFDPGGTSGVALARVESDGLHFKSGEVACVEEAVDWFQEVAGNAGPVGIGIDALLTWSTTAGGWRQSDRYLRKAYPAKAGSVICSNSAYGAMAVQGMAFAFRARAEWPDAVLNEVHPKVLFHAAAPGLDYPRTWPSDAGVKACTLLKGCVFENDPTSEHEFDAVLGAWATFMGRSQRWAEDLSDRDLPGAILPVGEVHYFWPERPKPQ